jgi:hypothetical protein
LILEILTLEIPYQEIKDPQYIKRAQELGYSPYQKNISIEKSKIFLIKI